MKNKNPEQLNKMTHSRMAWRRRLAWIAIAWLPFSIHAEILTSRSFTISSGGGGGGGGAQTSCMIFSDGSSWSGGAVGVQGAASTKSGGGSPLAANVTFKFGIGSAVETLNATYGAGNWTVENIQLTFQYTLYTNNTRFGGGAGGLDLYWIANDSWVQGTSNPVYATDAAGLAAWSGGQVLLATENYSWTTPGYTGTAADATNSGVWVTDKTGARQSLLAWQLDSAASFVGDITSATAAADPNLSIYLMATGSATGLTIFAGGGTSLPTLSFDVATVPEPGTVSLLALSMAWLGFASLRRKS